MSISCPRCGASLIRVHRRPVDRLVSLFKPMRRYRCSGPECEWTGNLPHAPSPGPEPGGPMSTPTSSADGG